MFFQFHGSRKTKNIGFKKNSRAFFAIKQISSSLLGGPKAVFTVFIFTSEGKNDSVFLLDLILEKQSQYFFVILGGVLTNLLLNYKYRLLIFRQPYLMPYGVCIAQRLDFIAVHLQSICKNSVWHLWIDSAGRPTIIIASCVIQELDYGSMVLFSCYLYLSYDFSA